METASSAVNQELIFSRLGSSASSSANLKARKGCGHILKIKSDERYKTAPPCLGRFQSYYSILWRGCYRSCFCMQNQKYRCFLLYVFFPFLKMSLYFCPDIWIQLTCVLRCARGNPTYEATFKIAAFACCVAYNSATFLQPLLCCWLGWVHSQFEMTWLRLSDSGVCVFSPLLKHMAMFAYFLWQPQGCTAEEIERKFHI